MKTEFELDSHLADLTGAKIQIVGRSPVHKPYVRIELPDGVKIGNSKNTCMFICDNDLERFAVNILRALKSKRLKL